MELPIGHRRKKIRVDWVLFKEKAAGRPIFLEDQCRKCPPGGDVQDGKKKGEGSALVLLHSQGSPPKENGDVRV